MYVELHPVTTESRRTADEADGDGYSCVLRMQLIGPKCVIPGSSARSRRFRAVCDGGANYMPILFITGLTTVSQLKLP